MKIHTINFYNKPGYHSSPNVSKAELYENNNAQGYNVNFSGSGAKESSEAAAKVLKKYIKPSAKKISDEEILNRIKDDIIKKTGKAPKEPKYGEYGDYPQYSENLGHSLWGRFISTDHFDKNLFSFNHNPSWAQAFMALFIAGGLRPATNMAMSSKEDRGDAMYAASHAIASALIGYIVSSIVLKPFEQAFKEINANPEKYLKGKEYMLKVSKLGSRTLETSAIWKNISQICKMSFDTFLLGIPKAMLTIALIPPILKYVFGMEKKSKKQPSADATVKVNNNNTNVSKSNPIFQMSMKNFLGGNK